MLMAEGIRPVSVSSSGSRTSGWGLVSLEIGRGCEAWGGVRVMKVARGCGGSERITDEDAVLGWVLDQSFDLCGERSAVFRDSKWVCGEQTSSKL